MKRNVIPFKIEVFEGKKCLQVHYNQVLHLLARCQVLLPSGSQAFSALKPVQSPPEFSLNWMFVLR